MSVIDFCFGRPLRSSEERAERLGAAAGIPVFGLDALSSAAYGPEAALALLIPLGAAGISYILPITISIVILLLIVYFSYRQTIEAYPQGGGSYTVAGQNLGPFAGLLAATALMIDYVLTAAVGISAGVGALVSAIPKLQPHTLMLCLAILLLITLVNLRGSRETGAVFMLPTYLFLGTLGTTIVAGIGKAILSGGHPTPVEAPPALPAATAAVGLWLLLRAFASGCTAMTGVEAVSNGVTAFREPVVQTARRTLTTVIALLAIMLLGIAYLCRAYQIGAVEPGPGYQSVLSQLTAAVVGRNVFYLITIGSVLLVLSFSANTAFADFPRLCRLIAQDGYLPVPLAERGRRLVYTWGITTLALLCAALLILFGGVTDRLIPLFAVGAFLAFTLSQAGMVAHWRRKGGSRLAISLNALGAVATAGTAIIVTVTKFLAGAWITTLLIPLIMIMMFSIRRHYDRVRAQIAHAGALDSSEVRSPIVVMPMMAWTRVSRAGLQFAFNICSEIHVVHVSTDENKDEFVRDWRKVVEGPVRTTGLRMPELKVLKSPYRFVITPIVDYVLELEAKNPGRQIAVIVPELVERHWYLNFLHNQRATWLKAALLMKGNRRIVIINVPWYMD
ncbi:MAG TPA: APC family permease [Rugosimonospora sp.]|nr:APC family permease [Rugosimonospora sp.]